MTNKRRAAGARFLALFVVGLSAAWMLKYREVAAEDVLALVVTAGIGIGGLAVAVAIWRSAPGAVRAYVAWAVLDVVGIVVLDARTETIGDALLGGWLAAVVLGLVGFWLRRSSAARDVAND
ncbi:MAG: hypothetical protein KAI24_18160 [Planctomycetes bacterium]|nr:hypothetical protein [Planctomycetota bacterium]